LQSSPHLLNAASAPAVLATAASVTFLVALDSSLLNVALPAIKNSFPDASTSNVAWVINIYSLALASMLIPAGYLADRWGRIKLLRAGVGIFLLGCIFCGMAGSILHLLAARLLQGVGGALALPASLTLVVAHFSGAERAISVGKWSAAGALAAAVGPPLGAFLMHYGSWRTLFFLHVPLCVWILLRSGKVPVNAAGNVTISRLFVATPILGLGTGLLVAAFTVDLVGSSFVRLLATASGLALFSIAIIVMRREEQFLGRFDLLTMAVTASLTFCFGAMFGAMFILFDFALVYRFHFSIPAAAILMGSIPLLSMPVARNCGKLHRQYSLNITLLTGAGALLMVVPLSFLMLAAGFVPAIWIAIVTSSSIGIGLCFPSLSIAAVRDAHPDYFALVTGMNQSCRHLGTVIGVAAVGLVLSRELSASLVKASWLIGVFAAGAVISSTILWLEGGMGKSHDQELSPKLANQP